MQFKILISTIICFIHFNIVAEPVRSLPVINVTNFADIVEPLLPAVVNISTIHYPSDKSNNKNRSKRNYNDESLDFFNDFLEKFGIPPQQFDESFTDRKVVSLGSGFIIDSQGYIVTNYHVIKDADEINVKMYDNSELAARVIGSDPRTDLALLKVEFNKALPFVKFGESSKVRTGDWVIAIGNPYRLGGTVTAGIVSSSVREVDVSANGIVDEYIQTDAAINRGNSGGPLFNLKGEVIGVNTAIHSTSPNGGNIGIGFAIPATITEKVIDQLKLHGKISRGMLGIRIQPISEEIAESLNIPAPYHGALVVDTFKGEPGEKAGIKTGDIILEFNGVKIKNSNKLPRLVAEVPLNSKIKLIVLREGKNIELETIITENKADELSNNISNNVDKNLSKDNTSVKHGITFANIDDDIRQKYGLLKNVNGVIIIKAEYNSDWLRRGILKGDLIVGINQQVVNNVKDFNNAYNNAIKEQRKHLLLLVKRQDNTLFIAVPIGK